MCVSDLIAMADQRESLDPARSSRLCNHDFVTKSSAVGKSYGMTKRATLRSALLVFVFLVVFAAAMAIRGDEPQAAQPTTTAAPPSRSTTTAPPMLGNAL